MKQNNFNSKTISMRKELKRIIIGTIITVIILFCGNYYLNQKITKAFDLKEQGHVVENNQYSTVILSDGNLPSVITEDTYLTKGTYTVNSDLTIEAGVTLEVEAGTTITFSFYKNMTIDGTLKLNGTIEENINIDHYFLLNDGAFITIGEGGTLDSTYTNIKNTATISYEVRNTLAINNNGTLKLSNSKITSAINIFHDITSNGNIEMINSEIPRKININEGSSNFIIKDNIIKGDITIPFGICDITTFDNVKNNTDASSNPKTIILTGSPVNSIKLSKQNYNLVDNLTILEDMVFEVEAGSNITFSNDKRIIVDGTLKLNGTLDEEININHFLRTNDTAFITVSETGVTESTYTNIMNTATISYEVRNTLSINNNGIVNLNNTKITSAVNIFYDIASNGNIEIINSQIPRQININEGSSNVVIKDNIVKGDITIPLSICDITTFDNIKNNTDASSNPKTIILTGNPVTNVKLPKEKYVFPNDLIVPVNTTFEVEAGANLTFNTYRKIIVNGTLLLNGNETENINIAHFLISNGVAFIEIGETGTLESTYTNMKNSGTLSYEACTTIAIKNNGTAKLDNTEITSANNIFHDVINSGNIEIINSQIPRQIIINENSGYVILKDNIVKGDITIPLSICDVTTFTNINNNKDINNNPKPIKLTGNPVDHVKLFKQNYFFPDNLTIPENIVFEVEEGTTLRVNTDKNITVNGILNLSGTLDEPIKITNLDDRTYIYWGSIKINPTGVVFASNVDIRQAGYSSYPIENQGQLVMWNSIIANGYLSRAIRYNTTNPEQFLSNNSILGNVTSNIEVQAHYNFWGHESGPRRRNPETGIYIGSGFTVSDNIVVEPFHTSFIKTEQENFEFIKINETRHFGIPGVNSSSGNYSKQFTDFNNQNTILGFERTYNSRSEQSGILGSGWTSSLSSSVKENPHDPNSYLVYLPNGSINIFNKQSDNTYIGINSRNTFEIVNEKYIFTKVDQTIYTYNNNGILESITDKYGNITQIIVNSSGNITSIVDYVNREYLLEYNSNNLLTKITDPIGRIVTYTYNDNNLLETVTNEDGVVTTYIYDSNNLLISVKENNVEIEKIEYLESGIFGGKVFKYTNQYGNEITYSYDQTANITTETDLNGYVTQNYYDREGYVYKIVNPDNTQILTTYNTVDGTNKYGEVLTNTNIYSHKTTYTRDPLGRVTKITNPDLSYKQYTYNSKNNIIMELDELGNITEYIYDSDEVTLLHVVKPIDGFTLYDSEINPIIFEMKSYTYYNPSEVNGIKGLLETKTDEKGLTTYEYDLYGNISKVIDGNLNETKYTSNKLGWILTEQKNDNYITNYQYNNSGNLTKLVKDLNTISITEYNYQNKSSKIIDGNNNFELIEYDKALNIIKKTDREGNITNYEYDLYGNLIKKINPNNSIYTYQYDKLNRLTKTYFKEDQSSASILLEEKTYTNVSNYTITTKTYTAPTLFKTKIETYNYQNKLISEKNENVTKSNTYLKNGLISYEMDGNAGYTYYFYTKTNHLEKKYVMTDANQYIVSIYVYDNYGRVIEEKVGKEKVTSTTELPITFISTYYEYNDNGQVIKKTTSSLEEINYTYDEFGNIISEITKIDSDNYQTKEYKYNYLNKVIEEKNDNIITQYDYDNVGNLIEVTTGENKVTEYVYNKNSKVTKTIIDTLVHEQFYYDSMNNIIKKIDGNNNIYEYIYDKQNNLIEEKNPKLLSTYYSYDLNNRLVEFINPNNTVTTYMYDKFDNVIKKTIQDEIIYEYEYDNNNNLTKEKDPLGYITLYTYDKTNKLNQVTDKLNYTIEYEYDTQLNIISEKNKKGQYTYYAYDERNNIISKTINDIVVEQNEYDLLNNLIKTIDGNLNEINYEYNNIGQLIKKINPLGYTEEYEYNDDGQLVRIFDNLDKETIYSYDNNGNIINEIVQKIDGTERIEISNEYDLNNNLIKNIDGNRNITTYQYDSLNNLVKTINPLNQETTYTYDNNSNLVGETNYLEDSKTYIYDEYDRLIETKNELDQTIEILEYDLNSRQIKSIDALGKTITYVYDKNDNIIETIDQLNHSEETSYDQLGNITSKTDKNGNVTTYEYDINQNLIKVTNALNEVTEYLYDNNNNLTKVTDARGKIIEYTYDSLNNELTEKDGLGKIEYKEYYSNGLLKKKITRNQDIINYTYDIHGRLVIENDITYSYDDNNNLLEILDFNNQTVRVYDSLNRVTSKTENGLTSTFIYDIDGYKEKTIDPLLNETIKEYDKSGRLIKVNNEAEYIYNIDGTLQKVIYINGATEEYFYNEDKTLNKLVNTYDSTIEEYIYTYDNNKNIIEEVNPNQTIVNTYDALNRLKTVSLDGIVTTYTYDKSGNRLKEVTGTITKDYTYDSKNKLSKITEKDNGVVTKVTTYEYDDNGNNTDVKVLEGIIEDTTKDVYYIKTIQNNLYVGIKGNLDTNGSNVELTALGQEGKQEWKLIELPNGNYELRAYNSTNNQTMNIAGGSSSNGTNINIYQSDDSNAQQFKLVQNIDGSYSIKTQASNFNGCIDVSGGIISLGSNIQQYSCNGTTAQKFNLIPISEEQPDKECDPDIDVCYIKTIQNNLYVGIKGNLDTNGSNVELTALGQEGKQEWKLIELPNGNYELRAYNSINNQTMNIAGGSSSNGTNINIYQSDDSNAQQFKLVQNIDGSYSIKTQASNFNGCIDVSGGNISLGFNIQQYSCNGTAAQKFNLIAVPIEEEEEEPQGIIEEITTNVYNERNELISTTKNEQTTTYQYNAEGKRISKSDGSDITKFIYEGTKIILELDDLNNEIARNTYGLALVSREVNNEVGYYLYNGHGDTVVIIDSDNEVLNTYEYDVWGVIISETESLDNPYKYAGYYYDTETGNYYLLSRYYNPVIARFISEDTYRGELSDPLSLNRYVYVVNNPMIYTDPDGQAPIPVITSGIGGLFGLGATFIQDLLDDGKINTDWKTYVGNTAQGATTGFALGLCGPKCGGIGGFVGDAVNQYITKGEVDWTQSMVSGVTTGVTAGIFNYGGSVTSNSWQYLHDYMVKGVSAGIAGDMTYQFTSKGITRDEYGKATGYNIGKALNEYNPIQTLQTGVVSSFMAPIGAKIVETAIVKFGPQASRPSWRKSELDVGKDYKGYEQQKSFLDGKEVPYGTKGSSRPEFYNNKNSIEVKNYNIESSLGRKNLIRNVSNQVNQRVNNLPSGTKQTVIIDTRGQIYNGTTLQEIRSGIIQKSNTSVEVRFK